MPELPIFAGKRLRKEDFEQFKKDLELLLESFSPGQLAAWMRKDRRNFSRKLNGIEAITPKFLLNFRRALNPVIDRLRRGVPAYQVIIELETGGEVAEEQSGVEGEKVREEKVWEEIRELNRRLDELEGAMRALQRGGSKQQGVAGRRRDQG